jgi:hypothetical protein
MYYQADTKDLRIIKFLANTVLCSLMLWPKSLRVILM